MVDATKIAKLRAKAQSTSYPQEAAMFERKAADLMAQHGITEDAVASALAEIFGRPASPPPPQREARPKREAPQTPAERGTMIEAAIWVLEEEGNRPMRARDLGLHRGSRPLQPQPRQDAVGNDRCETRDRNIDLRARRAGALPATP
jgi:hypothetical protein